MQISPVSSFSNGQYKNNPSFSSRFLIDVGGSVGENSLKALIIPNKSNKTIYKMKNIVNTQGERVYSSAEDFLRKLAGKMAQCYQEGLKINPKDKTVKDLVFFMPGSVYNNKLLYADNIRGQNSLGMSDIDFNLMPKFLKEAGVKIAKNCNVRLFQDSMGSGLAIANKLNEKNMLHAGDHYSVAITGGGCGISNIRAVSETSAIVDATGSSYFTDEQGLVKIANAGASASKLITNFCNAMGINKQIVPEIANCGVGQVVTSEIFILPKGAKGEKLKNLLLSLKKLAPKDSSDPASEKVLKPIYTLYDENSIKVTDDFSKDFKHARRSAIDKYASSLAKFAVIKENEGANGLIVTGPLGFALDKALRKHHSSSLSEVISQKISERYNTFELDKISESHKFKVICNPEFSLEDNTEARELALNTNLVGNHRFNWLQMNFDK
ncbi:hypothetical protein J6G99_04475 [bacterium]|nr:hypothetical protein [bacterium]